MGQLYVFIPLFIFNLSMNIYETLDKFDHIMENGAVVVIVMWSVC